MNFEERFITSTKNESDAEIENKLRPTKMDEYVSKEKNHRLHSVIYWCILYVWLGYICT